MKPNHIVRALSAIATLALLIVLSKYMTKNIPPPDVIQDTPAEKHDPIPNVIKPKAERFGPSLEKFKAAETGVTDINHTDKVLRHFMSLDEKVLLSHAEQLEREKLLSDPEALKKCESTLLLTTPASFTKDGHKKRFESLFFIERALEWEGNPLRPEILQKVETLIEAPNFSASIPIEIRRSIAGDKMELYTMLDKIAPGKAENVLSRSRGTPLERVLQYAQKRFSH